jgi:hypothetical protein
MAKQEIDDYKSLLDKLVDDQDWQKIPPLSRDKAVSDNWEEIAEIHLHEVMKTLKPKKRGRKKKADDEHTDP